MKYNPQIHDQVVRNLRNHWVASYGPPDLSPLVLSDEEIWNCHEEMDRDTELTMCHLATVNGDRIEGNRS